MNATESPTYELSQAASKGPWDGPTYAYRGARLECMKGGHVCGLFMPDHPLDGKTFGVPGTITPLVDFWLDQHVLPAYMRLVRPEAKVRL
jgi:hypothetical protein